MKKMESNGYFVKNKYGTILIVRELNGFETVKKINFSKSIFIKPFFGLIGILSDEEELKRLTEQ